MTCLDLSPYYLHEARANLRRWARLRAPGLAMGGVDGNGAAFLQAAAEDIPQPDGSFDVVRARQRTDLCRWHRRCWGGVVLTTLAHERSVIMPGGLVLLTMLQCASCISQYW